MGIEVQCRVETCRKVFIAGKRNAVYCPDCKAQAYRSR